MKSKKGEESGISRRSFLKTSAALGVAATMSGLPTLSEGAEKKRAEAKPRMKPGMVNSVLGPISPSKLGSTLMHEHFVFSYPGWEADETLGPIDFKGALQTNLEVIKKAQKYGIKTIVDATPNDNHRDPLLYKTLAQKTGMNIICSTGLYTEEEGSAVYFKTKKAWFGLDLAKFLSEIFIKEITQGIGKSGVLAGVIKVASSPKMTPYEADVHKAAVIAQKATGVPIITHTQGPTGGVEQADFLKKEGADCTQVMIGHVSNSKDIEYHKAILQRGVYIAFDRIGLEPYGKTEDHIKNISELCKLGFADKIMLSQDTVNYWWGRQIKPPEAFVKALENYRIDFITEKFLPAIKAQGVTDDQIKQMMEVNPKNLFMGN
jgi:phosphotriesterase-related protein